MNIKKIKVILVSWLPYILFSCLLYAVLGLIALIESYFIFILIDKSIFSDINRGYDILVVPFLYLLCGPMVLVTYVVVLVLYDYLKLKITLWIIFCLVVCMCIAYRFWRTETLVYSTAFGLFFALMQFFAAFISLKIGNKMFRSHR